MPFVSTTTRGTWNASIRSHNCTDLAADDRFAVLAGFGNRAYQRRRGAQVMISHRVPQGPARPPTSDFSLPLDGSQRRLQLSILAAPSHMLTCRFAIWMVGFHSHRPYARGSSRDLMHRPAVQLVLAIPVVQHLGFAAALL